MAEITRKDYPRIGETLYSGKLENGLQIFVVPKKGFSSCYAAFATRYGGAMRKFEIDGKTVDTPAGVAHYLEHKMFDMPDGNNALTVLSENGADPNAFTSTDFTCYYFNCTSGFEENFRSLLSFVSTPYFTPETVQKEMGIITQEILMGDDSPSRRIYYNLLSILYDHHPIREPVIGTVESISKITDQTLYDCHRVFYAPSNMVLCVEGDVDPETVFSIAEEVLPSERRSIPLADFGEPESLIPVKSRIEEEMPVSAPGFLIGAKVTDAPLTAGPDAARDRILRRLTGSLALRLLVGNSSPLYARLYGDGTLTHDFDYEIDYTAGTATVIIGGEGPDPDKVLQALQEEVAAVAKKGFDEAFFSRMLKAMIGGHLRGYEDFENVCLSLAEDYYDGFCTLDVMDLLPDIRQRDCARWIAENLAPDRLAVSILYPLRDK